MKKKITNNVKDHPGKNSAYSGSIFSNGL